MAQLNVRMDEKLVKEFRDVVYKRYGLKKGDLQKSIEEAMMDYVRKYWSRAKKHNAIS